MFIYLLINVKTCSLVASLIIVHLYTTVYDSFSKAIAKGINTENVKNVTKIQHIDIIKTIVTRKVSEV